MLELKRISAVYGMKIFTESGDFFGMVEEVVIINKRIDTWRITGEKNSLVSKLIKDTKGVLVSHKLIKAIGEIIIVYDAVIPPNKQEGVDE